MTGRARGPGTRARPRVLAPGEQPFLTEEEAMAGEETSSSENGNGSGSGDAARGRGGLRSPLITKPPNITTTVGSGGRNIKILANYVRINVPTDDSIYDYHVDFEPNVEGLAIRRALVSQLSHDFGDAYIFDGTSNLKSCVDLPSPSNFTAQRRNGETYTIIIRQVGDVTYGSYEMLRLYNTQMRRNLSHIGLKAIGRYFYESQPFKRLPDYGGVAIYRGFLTAVNNHDGGVLSVSDAIFKFVRRETVRDILQAMHETQNPKWAVDAKKLLAGQVVMTVFNNKTYRVSDIDFVTRAESTFTRSDGSKVTFVEYYKEHYDIDIEDKRQPMLVAASTERDRRTHEYPPSVLLVPELCFMTGLTDKMRSDHAFMRQVAQSSKVSPLGRVAHLKNFIREVNSNPNVQLEMGRWNMKMDDNLVAFEGRVMDNENLIMGGETTSRIINGDFNREMRGRTLFKTVSFDRWAIVFPARDEAIAIEFKNTLIRVAEPMNINLASPRPFKIENDRAQSYISALRKIPLEAQLIVCIVPNNNKDRYDAIKKFLCIDHPVPSQVVTTRILNKKGGMMSICTKIAIQVACKGGAEPWSIDIPPKNIMIIGFDTYHDSSVKGRSAGGFVCTMNDTLTQYYSKVHFHDNREEMSNDLGLSTARAVMHYIKINGGPPDRIIVYRDGVSDGMVKYVFDTEVDMCKKGIERGNEGRHIALTFIIVNKRVNSRFFGVKDESTVLNPPPGTIVDKVVTRLNHYDFYLISQAVTEGTVAPTLFDIICDESGWQPTNHQKLAYKLAHLYYNWAGTVKVPAPCQYAHKLAFLCGQSLHKEPHAKFEKTLFYL